MATRSIKLKLIVPRGSDEESAALRRDLWRTHAYVNEAVRYYEGLLLEMRQGDVLNIAEDGTEQVIAADQWATRLQQRLRGNGLQEAVIAQVLPLFAALYKQVIPSAVDGKEGTAQAANAFLSPLVDPESKGGAANDDAYAPWRPLLAHRGASPEETMRVATRILLESSAGSPSFTGRAPRWLLLRKKAPSDPAWALALLAKLEEMDAGASSKPLDALRTLGAIPLAPPFNRARIEPSASGAVDKFDRKAFALAAGHLNSWESWGFTARKQYADRRDKVARLETLLRMNATDAVSHLESYEAQRLVALREAGALSTAETRYRIRLRELRGWERLYEWLQAHPDASEPDARTKVAETQSRLGSDFGGADLLSWLAMKEQRFLSVHSVGDVVSQWARRNVAQEILERTRERPVFTYADARLHPRFMEYDDPSNSNAPNFDLAERKGGLALTLRLLRPVKTSNKLRPSDVVFGLAPSRQLRGPKLREVIVTKTRHLRLDYEPQDGLGFEKAEVGGSALLFHRPSLESAGTDALSAGDIGAVWFKLSVTVGEENEPLLRENGKRATWVTSGLLKRADRTPPTRVLAADLGVRTAASCAVFRLGTDERKKGLRLADGTAVVHERSMKLALPGEGPDARSLEARGNADSELRALRASIGLLKQLRRLARATDRESQEQILDALELPRAGSTPPTVNLTPERLQELRRCVGRAMRPAAAAAWSEIRAEAAGHLHDWRKKTRSKGTRALGGKSAWSIEYLERVRKTLMSWFLTRAPDQEDIRRLDRGSHGTYARRLLDHITNLKKDRVKTTADLIVQAARGIVYIDGQWVKRHEPCEVIILEDLGRYRFQTDRPRRENSQLMRWAHREINKQVKEQASVYGIAFAETPAAFSSRFDAINRAPGIRCEVLTKERILELQQEPPSRFRAELEDLGIDVGALLPGDLVPRAGGEMFASIGTDGRARVRHADINAAQNLALRAIEAHQMPIRLPCSPVGDRFVSSKLGVRNGTALGGTRAVLESRAGGEAYSLTGISTDRQVAKLLGVAPADLDDAADDSAAVSEDDDQAVFESAIQAATDTARKRETFFRDPSQRLGRGAWMPAKAFWGRTRKDVTRALRETRDRAGRPTLHG